MTSYYLGTLYLSHDQRCYFSVFNALSVKKLLLRQFERICFRLCLLSFWLPYRNLQCYFKHCRPFFRYTESPGNNIFVMIYQLISFLCAYYACQIVSSSLLVFLFGVGFSINRSPKNNRLTKEELFRLAVGSVAWFFHVNTKKNSAINIYYGINDASIVVNKLPWLQLPNPLTFFISRKHFSLPSKQYHYALLEIPKLTQHWLPKDDDASSLVYNLADFIFLFDCCRYILTLLVFF